MKFTKQVSIIKIISGGQTGVDRAALDVANRLGLEHGGFCPKGRLAEDGVIQGKYNLTELNSSKYSDRTLENVKIAEGSLIIYQGIISGGTQQTMKYCQKHNKPVFEINLLEILKQTQVNFEHWIKENQIAVLNVAGPRESEVPIYDRAYLLLITLLSKLKM